MMPNILPLCLRPDGTIRQAMACIENNKAKIALVVDDEDRLIDTITDGDVRRAILAGVDLNSTVSALRDRRASSIFPEPVRMARSPSAQSCI